MADGDKTFELERIEYEVIEAGSYPVVVRELEKVQGRYGPEISWRLQIEGTDTVLRAWTAATLSDGSKLGRWATAVLGAMPDKLTALDLIGGKALAEVGVELNKQGREFNKVRGLLPIRKRAKPRPVAMEEELGPEGADDGPERF